MSSSLTEIVLANAVSVNINNESLSVDLDDGRTVSIPISWYPRLFHASNDERQHYRFIGNGAGIYWEDLDEDISIEGILAGRHSQETQASLRTWLKERTNAG